jgi:hypothetical protein
MQGANTLDEFVEHTMNFALTAYHMTDWVWAVIQRGTIEAAQKWERDQWIAVMGFESKALYDVIHWARVECPELEYCRQLANASKHLSCKLNKDAPAAEFEVAATEEWRRRQKEAPFMSILNSHLAENWRLVLIDDGKEVDLVEVLERRVFGFWSELTYRIYIGEG